jgi:hypothetical protein
MKTETIQVYAEHRFGQKFGVYLLWLPLLLGVAALVALLSLAKSSAYAPDRVQRMLQIQSTDDRADRRASALRLSARLQLDARQNRLHVALDDSAERMDEHTQLHLALIHPTRGDQDMLLALTPSAEQDRYVASLVQPLTSAIRWRVVLLANASPCQELSRCWSDASWRLYARWPPQTLQFRLLAHYRQP